MVHRGRAEAVDPEQRERPVPSRQPCSGWIEDDNVGWVDSGMHQVGGRSETLGAGTDDRDASSTTHSSQAMSHWGSGSG